MKIELENGKYTYIFNKGRQEVLRHCELWRDCTGDNFILAMAQKIESLENELTKAINIIEDSGVDYVEFDL